MSTPSGAATQTRGGRKENAFTRKIGPLPMWAWVGIGGALLIGWAWYENRQNNASSSSGTTANASEVPQFVNQTYTTVQPPAAPGSGSPSGGSGSTTPEIPGGGGTPGPTPVGTPVTVGGPPVDRKTTKPPAKKKPVKKATPKKKATANPTGGTGILGKGGSVGGVHGVTKTTGPTRKPTGTTGTAKGTTGGTAKTTVHHVVAHPARKTNPPTGTRKVA